MLTIPQAAREFGFPYWTLLRLVNEGEIVSLSIPGRRTKMLDPVDVQAFIERVKSGSVVGSVDSERPPQVALSKESPVLRKKRRSTRKSQFDHVFARKGKSCS
jgi:hypothetical protein